MSVFHLARWHLMSEVSQDWQMYILFELLSDFKGTHTCTDITPHPLDFLFYVIIFLVFVLFPGGF